MSAKVGRTPPRLRRTNGGSVREDPQASSAALPAGRLPIVALLLWGLFAFVVPSFAVVNIVLFAGKVPMFCTV